MFRLAEQEAGHCQSKQPPLWRYLVQARPGKLGSSSLKPKEEKEFQGPPDLGVDTQIHPVSDLPNPNPAVSHPASSAVINHTHSHPQGRSPWLLSEETFFSASPTQGVSEPDRGTPGFLCWPVDHPGFWLRML